MNTRSLKYVSLIFSCISMVMVFELIASEDNGGSSTPGTETELSDSKASENESKSTEKPALTEESAPGSGEQRVQSDTQENSVSAEESASGSGEEKSEIDNTQINNVVDARLEEFAKVHNDLEEAVQDFAQVISSFGNNMYVIVKDGNGEDVVLTAPKTEKINNTMYGYRGDMALRKMHYQRR